MQILQEQMIPFKSQKQHQIGILATIHLGYLQTWVKSAGLKLPKKRNKYCKTWFFLCGSKPGRQAAMQKPKNIDSVQLVGDNFKKAAK